MPLQKQNLPINFSQGVETKTDPFQVEPGKFLALSNSVFTKGNLLQKRNGFGELADLPDTTYTYLTTFKQNLTAIGTNLAAYSDSSLAWVNKGYIQPVLLETMSLVRSNTNQSQCDAAVASNGLICTAYTDVGPASTTYKYAVADSETGQNIIATQTISAANGTLRVFALGNYFVIVFKSTTANHLQFIAISTIYPHATTAAADIATDYLSAGTDNAWEGVVTNNNLYIAYNTTDGGGAIRITYLDSTLLQHGTATFAAYSCTSMSLCADETQSSPIIYLAWMNNAIPDGRVAAVDQNLNSILTPTQIIAAGSIPNITCAAQDGICTAFYEVTQAYSYDAAVPTNKVTYRTVTQAGVVGTATTLLRSVGLASKAFILNDAIYVLTVYKSPYQSTYFLSDASGHIIGKLAYQNGPGYLTKGLPLANVSGDEVQISYLLKTLITPVNKNTNVASGTQIAGIYAQTGVNLSKFTINTDSLVGSEIGNNLNLSGGFLWAYDGFFATEQGFFLYPDSVEVTTSAAGGSIADSTYYYVATYEWSDNQGNIFRSAPSIPVKQITAGGNTSTNTINVPTLRLTYKTANPVKIVVYRWSTAQQIYYQVTSVTVPTLNSTTTDSVAIVDTFADSTIIGNSILYTTGGVVENIGPPATSSVALYRSRLFLIDSEDGTLWYSKQVLQDTPVELSDLFTIFVAPTIGAQGSTGKLKCIAPMDDKLILFKQDAIYYLVGNGPDNTGANNDYSDPVFVTSTVGSSNQNSIVFIPQGLLFQSDKGIWLLGRDLSTSYIGSPVEQYTTGTTVKSALVIPGTNQVRFTMSSGITLMYDYFYGQWGTFTGIPSISSTLFEDVHTFIDSYGRAFQETSGSYLDGSNPVLMSFTTSWFNLAGLQGYERAYFFYLLGTYLSPHKLQMQIAYDYGYPSQTVVITPDNYNGTYGSDPIYGNGSPLGGPASLEQWRVFLDKQKVQSFQITLNEIYDSSFGVEAGAGFTMSGLNLVVGMKSAYPRIKAANSIG